MRSLFLFLILIVCSPSSQQHIEDEIASMVKTLIQMFESMSYSSNERGGKIDKLLADLGDLSGRVKTIEGQMSTLKTIAKEAQMNTLKEVLDENFRTLKSSSTSCPSNDILFTQVQQILKDECMDGSHNCSPHAQCQDRMKGFSCSCLSGYIGDGVTCQEVNECLTGENKCDSLAECKNTDGGYTCQCPRCYIGDGYTCAADPGCLATSKIANLDGLGSVVPVNEYQSFYHATNICKDKGGRLLEGLTTIQQLEELKIHFRQSFNHVRSGHEDIWLGIMDHKWLEGRGSVNETLWTSKNGFKSQNGTCTLIAFQADPPKLWDLTNCDIKIPFFCQVI